MGAHAGRYVYAELDDFEDRKRFADEKLAFVKSAEMGSPAEVGLGGFMKGIGTETAKGGIGAIGKLIKSMPLP